MKTTWAEFTEQYREFADIRLALDLSRVQWPKGYLQTASITGAVGRAFAAMKELEAGEVANPDEKRLVGHYWLRNPELAPEPALRAEIETTLARIRQFAGHVHSGGIQGAQGSFQHLLVIGIGGSALGPQFVANALGHPTTDKLRVHFFDNTDPDGMDRVLTQLDGQLGRTLCIVISKSGGTVETRNGMLEARHAYERAGLSFEAHAVAITMVGSKLDQIALGEQPPDHTRPWLERFPMWDWVGGRTSETSAVGLLPAALQGLDIDGLLAGARACDEVTRRASLPENPAVLLALAWYFIGASQGDKDMVVIPYKDRLALFSRYLQQLVMESLGKEKNLDGKVVEQGIAVYGNKGSTDQHAYVQQLRDGLNNFFVVFIEVLKERNGPSIQVKPGITSGDYLSGFLLGTREALAEKDRQSVTITVDEVSPFAVGVLIALFERAVGFYASLIHINAYHQPGVEAGKKAAEAVVALQTRVMDYFQGVTAGRKGEPLTADQIARDLGAPEQAEWVFKICQHLQANPGRGVRRVSGQSAQDAVFGPESPTA